MPHAPTREEFDAALRAIFAAAATSGLSEITVQSQTLHIALSGEPYYEVNRMPVCCAAMRAAGFRQEILQQPPEGDGANLFIKYHLF